MKELTEEQKNKIREAQQEIFKLQDRCDEAFNTMIKDMGYADLLQAWHDDVDCLAAKPVDWIFDIVYNSSSYPDTDKCFEYVNKALAKYYNTYGNV